MVDKLRQNYNKERFFKFIKRDFLYISLLLFALIACVYTIGHVQGYINQCNEQWVEGLESQNCYCTNDMGSVISLKRMEYEYGGDFEWDTAGD